MKNLIAITLLMAFTAINAQAGGVCTAEKIGKLEASTKAAQVEAKKLNDVANYLDNVIDEGLLDSSEELTVAALAADARGKAIHVLNKNVQASEELVDCITTGK
jgi:hypothetical protein